MEEILNKILQEVVNINKKIEDIETKIEDIETKIGNIEKRLDKIEVRIDRLEERMNRLEARMDRLEERMDKFEARMDRLEERMDKFEARILDEINALYLKINKLEIKMENQKNEIIEIIDQKIENAYKKISQDLAKELLAILKTIYEKKYTTKDDVQKQIHIQKDDCDLILNNLQNKINNLK